MPARAAPRTPDRAGPFGAERRVAAAAASIAAQRAVPDDVAGREQRGREAVVRTEDLERRERRRDLVVDAG